MKRATRGPRRDSADMVAVPVSGATLYVNAAGLKAPEFRILEFEHQRTARHLEMAKSRQIAHAEEIGAECAPRHHQRRDVAYLEALDLQPVDDHLHGHLLAV